MSTAIVRKVYEDAWSKKIATSYLLPVKHADFDKFALRTFNRLAYEWEVSRFLTASYLFNLPDYYTHDILLWRINLNLLSYRFVSIIFHESNILQSLYDDATFAGFVQLPKCIFEHYQCRDIHLSKFYLYTYFVKISVVKHKESSGQIFEFKESYPHKLNLIQRHHIKPRFKFLATLIGTLSYCHSEKDSIPGDYPNTIFQQDNLAEILLALFIL